MNEVKPEKNIYTLNDEQLNTVVNWLNEKWIGDNKCEICHSLDWGVQDQIITPVLFSRGLVLGGTSYPQVMVICHNCGNTKYFNAVRMGIIKGVEDGN